MSMFTRKTLATMTEREKVLHQAKIVKENLPTGANIKALIFNILKSSLQSNNWLRAEQQERLQKKKDKLTISQEYNNHFAKIESGEISLWKYEPNYERIINHVNTSHTPIKTTSYDKAWFFTHLYSHIDSITQSLLDALRKDFISKLRETFRNNSLPEDLLNVSTHCELEQYFHRNNPLIQQSLYWKIWWSKGKKLDGNNCTRITIDPLLLLEDFDFKILYQARRWTEMNETEDIPTTEKIFANTHWHLNGPTLLL